MSWWLKPMSPRVAAIVDVAGLLAALYFGPLLATWMESYGVSRLWALGLLAPVAVFIAWALISSAWRRR